MSTKESYYRSIAELTNWMQEKQKSFLLVTYLDCFHYKGMAQAILIHFDTVQSIYKLALEWMSLGLDLYGDTLQEYYTYQFDNLEDLLNYLQNKYDIPVTSIPHNYSFDNERFPSPLNDKENKLLYEREWVRFQQDFKKGVFLDPSLKLIASSQ